MQEPPKPKNDTLFEAILATPETQFNQQISELQNQLDNERDLRKEDRFIFILVTLMLLNVVFFSVMDSLGGPIALLVLQVLFLIPVARRLGVQEAAQLLDRIASRVSDSITNGRG